MKTTKLFGYSAILLAIVTIAFSSCKKEKEDKVDTKSMQQLVQDENNMAATDDDVMNDVNTVLSGTGGKSLLILPCNVSVDSSTIIGDTIIYDITFNGLNCSGTRLRVGNVKVKKNINTHWIDAGATVYVYFLNLKITRVSNNKSITLNGVKKFVNVSGGRISDLGTVAISIVHRIFGDLSATFDDSTTRTWYLARQRTFTGTLGNLVMTIDGLGSNNGYNSLVSWGTNRNGELFYTQITQSIIRKGVCGWDPCAGVKVHNIPGDNKKVTFTAGFDNNNQPVPVSGSVCPTKYRIDWEKNGNSGTLFKFL